jgi:hypothetical protein
MHSSFGSESNSPCALCVNETRRSPFFRRPHIIMLQADGKEKINMPLGSRAAAARALDLFFLLLPILPHAIKEVLCLFPLAPTCAAAAQITGVRTCVYSRGLYDKIKNDLCT